jgi:outer membrane protein OmpU
MNKLTKIGVSALAGSLAMTAVHAAEGSVSVSTGFAFASTTDENLPTGPYQFDSVVFSASGETDGGITVSAKMELDNDNPASTDGMDDRSVSFGTDALGTVTFHGHGGSSVLGQWDDVTPHAYEEVWDTTSGADRRIDGRSGNNLITYDSPSFNGVMFKAAYQHDHSTDAGQGQDISHYSDFGIMVTPEMVEGLTVGYGFGELEPNTSQSIDNETIFVKYAVGGFTFGYQQSETDGAVASQTDESEGWGITYAVNENFTVGYGERDYDDDTSTTTLVEQNDKGFQASYTMGGMTIAGHMNENDNVDGSTAATADKESYEFALTFAF